MTDTLGIVIPAYRPHVDRLVEYVDEIETLLEPDTLRVELDDPEQETVDALEGLPTSVHTVENRRGKGAAITHGFERLGTDVLAFADADGSARATSLQDVVHPVLADEVTLAVGSRRHPEATVTSKRGLLRKYLGDAFVLLASNVLDVELHDYQCGAKAIRRDAWNEVRHRLYEPGFAWDVELIAVTNTLEYPVVEIPIEWKHQPGSTVSPLVDSLDLWRALLVIRSRQHFHEGSSSWTVHELSRRQKPLVDRLESDNV